MTGLVLMATSSFADIRGSNERLDHSIYAEHEPKLIVAGAIAEIESDEQRGFCSPDVRFRFSVDTVILGSSRYQGQTLDIPASSFAWPSELLPFQEGSKCALVLGKPWGGEQDAFHLFTVVPLTNTALQIAATGEEAKRILEREILNQLEDVDEPERLCALLLQVAPILTRNMADFVVPYSTSSNAWVMRAALCALIYATEEQEHIRRAALDVQQFFPARDGNGSSQFARQHFLKYYFFLENRSWRWGSRWNEEEASKHLRILTKMFSTGLISVEVQNLLDPEDSVAKQIPHGGESTEVGQSEITVEILETDGAGEIAPVDRSGMTDRFDSQDGYVSCLTYMNPLNNADVMAQWTVMDALFRTNHVRLGVTMCSIGCGASIHVGDVERARQILQTAIRDGLIDNSILKVEIASPPMPGNAPPRASAPEP